MRGRSSDSVGDANNRPTLLADVNFAEIAVIGQQRLMGLLERQLTRIQMLIHTTLANRTQMEAVSIGGPIKT